MIKCPSDGCQWTGELRSKTVSGSTPCCFDHRDLAVKIELLVTAGQAKISLE